MEPIDEVAKLHLEGSSLRELSRRTGTSVHTLSKMLKAAGHPVRSQAESIALKNKQKDWTKFPAKGHAVAVRTLYDKKKDLIREFRVEHGCASCGENHTAVLDLHHLDPGTKHPCLRTKMLNDSTGRRTYKGWMGMSLTDIEVELQKCVVLCSNCHRKLHFNEIIQDATS